MTGFRSATGTGAVRRAAVGAAGSPPLDWDVVADLKARVASRLASARSDPGRAGDDRCDWSEADQRALAVSLILAELEQWALRRASTGLPVADPETERAVAAAVLTALFGMGRLQPLLERADVEVVHIHGADRVVLELAGGRLEAAAPITDSDAALVELLAGWAARAGRTGWSSPRRMSC